MKVVTFNQYEADKLAFIQKHGKKYDYKRYTSTFEDGRYSQTYCFENGATFTEINEIVWERYETEVRGIKVEGEAKLFRTEYWSTDDSSSKYVFAKA